MLTLSKIIFKYVSSYFWKMCLAIWMCLLAHPTEEPCESEKCLSALLQLGRAESADLLDSDVLALSSVPSCNNCSSAFMASVAIAESKESISLKIVLVSLLQSGSIAVLMWEFMDITIAYLDAQAFITGSCSGKFTLGSGCYWVPWGHIHYLSTESHFLSKITRWFCCSCFIAMVGFIEVECGLFGPFKLETSQWVQRRHLFLVYLTYTVRMCSFELESSQLRCVPIYSFSLSFSPPTLGIWCLPLAHCIGSVQAHNPCCRGAKMGPFLSHIESHSQHRPA